MTRPAARDGECKQVENFLIVTERGGEMISMPQLERLYQRYVWAAKYSRNMDVAEFACGTGPGLGYLASVSASLRAGDISRDVLAVAQAHYGSRINLACFAADRSPFADASLDVVILFEAIYYLPDVDAFLREASRVLRPNGCVLIATANRDLPDFNPSPYSTRYFNPPELAARLALFGFQTEFYGGSPVARAGLSGKFMQLAKRVAVRLHLIPQSMKHKRFLKRLVFGKLVVMPFELFASEADFAPPVSIPDSVPDFDHQVIYCAASRMLK